MKVRHRRSIALFAIAAATCIGLYLGRPLILESHLTETPPKESDSVIVITTTDACHCALERCGEVQEIVHRILERQNRSVTLKIIDYAEDPDTANGIMQRFEAYLIPIVLVIQDGKVIYRSEWDLDEALLARAIEAVSSEEK